MDTHVKYPKALNGKPLRPYYIYRRKEQATQKRPWRVMIYLPNSDGLGQRKVKGLGSFPTELEARNVAEAYIKDPTSYTPKVMRNGRERKLYYIAFDKRSKLNPWHLRFYLSPVGGSGKRRITHVGAYRTAKAAQDAAEKLIKRALANALRARRMGA